MQVKQHVFGRLSALFLTIALGAMFVGCSPTVMPATKHEPTSAASVKLYQKEPEKYEMLGDIVVPVTPNMTWDEKGDGNAGFDALKAKAASMGANGVLFKTDPTKEYAIASIGYHGTYYQVPVQRNPKAALAQAIFVVKE